MKCTTCGYESPEGLKFCGQCGAPLAASCPSCGKTNPPGFRFCGHCGKSLAPGAPEPSHAATPETYTPPHLAQRILNTRSALEGERKQVTVLFADVAGFTSLSEKLDPEQVHAVMDGAFRVLLDEVHRYEGTINQFTGDGVMALFGAPLALENAPERAVRAALGIQAAIRRYGDELQRTRGIEFRMRIGLNTGPVVVGKIGDDLRMDYTAVGDTTNLAARLQAAAEPGSVLVSEHTEKLVAERFVTRPLPPLTLKGKSEPVLAFEALRPRPRRSLAELAARDLTPLVGRATELATLDSLFAQAVSGRGQMAFVAGEAGLGKSRLVFEFGRRIAGRPVTWVEGRCVSFAREMPLLPIIEVVKSSFGIEEADSEATIIERVERGVERISPALRPMIPYLRYLLAVDPGDPAVAQLDANARRFQIFEALKQVMLASAMRRPLVVVIEDLHWLDAPSEEYLNYISDALPTARVLLLCTYRPGYRNPFAERSYATRIALQPLTAEESTAMAAAMLETASLPPEVRSVIARKAEGNPFFVEEVTKSLVEIDAVRRTSDGMVLGRDASEIVIPGTIQDVIMARIDRLGEEPKRAIQVASVIGREFAARLLQRVADLGERLNSLVGELRSLELIYEKTGVPELAYMFKHALTHDVAYESLLVQRRKELHRVIGRAIEELYADRLGEYCETLAHHFFEGDDWAKAFEYLLRASEKAAATLANAEALYFLGRAVEAARHFEASRADLARLHELRANALFARSEFAAAIAACDDALVLAGSERDGARLEGLKAMALVWARDFEAANKCAERLIETGEKLDDPATVGEGYYSRSFVSGVRGDLAASERDIERACALADSAGSMALQARAGTFRALIRNWRGEYAAAIDAFHSIVAALRQENRLYELAMIYSHYTISLGGAGRYGEALAGIEEGIRLGERIGDRVWRARLWNTRGWILAELGSFEPAEEANRRCLEIAHATGSSSIVSELIGNAEANLADAAIAQEDLAGAERHLSTVAAILADRRNEWMAWRFGMHHEAAAAELALARGDLAGARRHVEKCLAGAERTRSRRYLVRGRRQLAAIEMAEGRAPDAERRLASVVADAKTLGNPTQLWTSLLAQARVLRALGRKDEAAVAAAEACRLLDGLRSDLGDEVSRAIASSAPYAAAHDLSS